MAKQSQSIFYMDQNDSLMSYEQVAPKVVENLPSGAFVNAQGIPYPENSTFGPWDYLVFLDDLTQSGWLDVAEMTGSGVGAGFIGFTLFLRAISMPLAVYCQVFAWKMAKIKPQLAEMQETMGQHGKAGDTAGRKMQMKRMNQLKKENMCYGPLQFL